MAVPSWWEVVTLTRGDEVPLSVFGTTSPVEVMERALGEQAKPATVKTYIFCNSVAVWADGRLISPERPVE